MASSFWDDFKDIFKTDGQKEEERQKKISDALKREQELAEHLRQLEDQYNRTQDKEIPPNMDELFPKDSGLKEKDYNPISDEELERLAGEEIGYKKQADKISIEEKLKKAMDKAESGGIDAKDEFLREYVKLQKQYDDMREKTEQKGIKNGLGRSSIVMEQMNDLNGSERHEKDAATDEYHNTIDQINGEIDRLKESRENALDELDLKYASELDNKIGKLKGERDATTLKYQKYNDSVREKNIKYGQDREDDIAAFRKKYDNDKMTKAQQQKAYEAEFGYSGEKKQNFDMRYELAYDFYHNLPQDIALQALEASPNMKYYLGNYYDKLKGAISGTGGGNKKYF